MNVDDDVQEQNNTAQSQSVESFLNESYRPSAISEFQFIFNVLNRYCFVQMMGDLSVDGSVIGEKPKAQQGPVMGTNSHNVANPDAWFVMKNY